MFRYSDIRMRTYHNETILPYELIIIYTQCTIYITCYMTMIRSPNAAIYMQSLRLPFEVMSCFVYIISLMIYIHIIMRTILSESFIYVEISSFTCMCMYMYMYMYMYCLQGWILFSRNFDWILYHFMYLCVLLIL